MSNTCFPAVAGQFYDASPDRLKEMIDAFKDEIQRNNPPTKHNVQALILPHAGYIYSGNTAIRGLMSVKEKQYKRIFLLAPSHRVSFTGIALSTYTDHLTPLGSVSVDCDTVKRLEEKKNPFITVDDSIHAQEHSLEVQLPLLHTFFRDVPIVPIVCGETDDAILTSLASDLKEFCTEDTLFLISSDFTHYGLSFNYVPFTQDIEKNIGQLDALAFKEILNINPTNFASVLKKTGATICGATPILLLLHILGLTGKKYNSELLFYTTSGELTGSFEHSVSYASIGFHNTQEQP